MGIYPVFHILILRRLYCYHKWKNELLIEALYLSYLLLLLSENSVLQLLYSNKVYNNSNKDISTTNKVFLNKYESLIFFKYPHY